MYQNYKVVVVTAAGRRRYMQYLIPYVVSCSLVDRYDMWINTHNGADIAFFEQVASQFPIVHLVWQPEGIVNGNASINAFYRSCTEEDAIYFKLDDDIIWQEADAMEKMIRFRAENPRYFLVSPLVINNALSSYLLQIEGKLQLSEYHPASAQSPVLWKSGQFAYELHHWFLTRYLQTGKTAALHIGKKEMGETRFSINAILWFGKDMSNFAGEVPGDDEEFLSCIYPSLRGLSNAWNGDAIMVHFAFFTQRKQLDKQNILEQYGEWNKTVWGIDTKLKSIDKTVQEILTEINNHEEDLMKRKSPYQKVKCPNKWRVRLKKLCPEIILDHARLIRERQGKVGYIKDL